MLAALNALDALDASERKALTLTTFTAACICFAPAELISGVGLLLASMLLYRWDQRILRREAQEVAAASAAAPASTVAPAAPAAIATEPPSSEPPAA